MILVCGGIKGGSGKTTMATNLAAMRAGAGKDVLLVDADEQESATIFTAIRKRDQSERPQYTSIILRKIRRRHCGYRRPGYPGATGESLDCRCAAVAV